MKKFIFATSCALLVASCSTYVTKETSPKTVMLKNEEIARDVASGRMSEGEEVHEFSTQEEIKEFLDQNNCVIKALDSKTGDLVYTRNLNQEIIEGQPKKSFRFMTKTYIEETEDFEGDSFANIFVTQPLKDAWGGEEIRIAFNFDKQPENFKRPLFNSLYINNSPDTFRENSKVWNSLPTLVGTDFVFKLTHSQRKYAFRCDAK
ncbi:MAG: hypothetical protein PHY93_11375 [Bacteriovorax sp.]|nr:hypothetical protein [Bacteriovorax sp.]